MDFKEGKEEGKQIRGLRSQEMRSPVCHGWVWPKQCPERALDSTPSTGTKSRTYKADLDTELRGQGGVKGSHGQEAGTHNSH